MMNPLRDDIVEYANGLVKLHDFPDYGPMGMQFEGDPNISGVASAVSVNTSIIQRAASAGCNLLLVHHGLFWNNESRILDGMHHGARLDELDAKGMTLLAYHLALDAHPKFGNNILLARTLGLGKLTPWEQIGWSGELKDPMSVYQFAQRAANKLEHDGASIPYAFPDGNTLVRKVAVIAGGAAHYIIQAKKDGFDTFVTGEPSEPSYHLAKDLGMNFFAFGHDATERAGVQKLGQQISKRFRIPHAFFPSPNPV
jgi:dinuclear metal center YbgI/SA1388 family protein